MNEHVRFVDFTKRQVQGRERLFNPETSDWPTDDDSGANWDYFMACVYGFAAAISLMVLGVFTWVFWDLVTWP